MKHITFDDIYEMFCSYYHDDGSNEKIMREKLIDAMKKFTQYWISVEEKLPETNEFYESKICLVKNTYGNVDVARYYSNTKSWYFNSSDFIVTHWRPIERQ